MAKVKAKAAPKAPKVEMVAYDCPTCEREFEKREDEQWIRCPHCRAYYERAHDEDDNVYIVRRVAEVGELNDGDEFFMDWRKPGKEWGTVLNQGAGSTRVSIPFFEEERTGSEDVYISKRTLVQVLYE